MYKDFVSRSNVLKIVGDANGLGVESLRQKIAKEVCKMPAVGNDNDMTGNEYQAEALVTASGKSRETNEDMLLNGLMGLNGEAGECIDMLKKNMYQGHDLDRRALALELGDVAWYLAVAAYALNYDLDTVFRMNIEKLRKRYPDGFSEKRSRDRKD